MNNKKKYFALPYLAWIAVFILIPLILLAYYGFTDTNGSFTLSNIEKIADPIHLKALWLSLLLSIISTFICLLLAYPLSIILRKWNMKSSSFIVFVFILPMWMNFLLRTYSWQTILEKNGVLNTLLNFLHLPAVNIINTPAAIVFGMVYNFLPFMILPIYNTLIKIDENIINAAKDLGAGNITTFFKIIFPLSLPGVISGITMVFVPSLTTFVVSDILGGSKILLIGNIIEQEFRLGTNWNVGAGLSIVLMCFILVSMALFSKYDKDSEGTGVW